MKIKKNELKRKTLFILNGPNLNLLGTREPEIYGSQTLEDVRNLCQLECDKFNFCLRFHQSNYEGQLVDWIQEAGTIHKCGNLAGVIINAAAYSHTSIALMDAIKSTNISVIELHISNIFTRENYRHQTYISTVAKGVICGLGIKGYSLAIQSLSNL